MTGFGHAVVSKDGRELSIELKSVNHRFLDLALRMPRSLAFLEDTARNTLGTMLARGHVDIFANYRNTRNDSKKVEINMPMLSAYMTAARQAAEELGIENDLTLSRALRLTDIVSVTEADDDRPALAELMKDALTRAANELIAMRMREGERLSSDMKTRLGVIADIREKISERAPLVVEEQRKKLNERIESLLSETEIDRARLATEIALFADKVSIDEELVRLSSHIAAAGELLENNGSIGRKLDFIVQEMNREFNTIGSKANDKTIKQLRLLLSTAKPSLRRCANRCRTLNKPKTEFRHSFRNSAAVLCAVCTRASKK